MKKTNNLTFYLKSRTTIILLLFIVYILLHLLFLFIIEDVNIMGVIAAPNLTPILFFNTILVVIVGNVANCIY